MNNRTPPAKVSRQLRQEAGFGCVICGCPIIEYHHIIEWKEKKHFDPDHMVALCPTHHSEYGKLPRQKSYSAKSNPFNIRKKMFEGYLGGNKEQKAIKVGGIRAIDCDSVISYSGNSLFSYRLIDREYRLCAFLPDSNFWPEVEIKDNAVTAPIRNFWDIEFKVNWVKFRKARGDVFLSIDFRNNDVEIEGLLNLLGQEIDLRKSSTKYSGVTFRENTVERCGTALSIGSERRLLRPNFAMRQPAARYF